MQSSARKLRGRDGTVQSPTRYFISIVRMYLSHPLRGNHHFSPLLHHGSPGRVLPVPCSHPHASLEGETVPCSHRHVTSLVSCECTLSHPLRGNHRFSPLLHHGSPGRVLPVPCSHPHASLEGETVPCSHRHVTSLVSCECTFPILSGGNHHFSPLMHHGSPGRVLPVPCSHPHASLEGETVPCSHRHVTSLVSCECTLSHPLRGNHRFSPLLHHGSPGRVLPVPCSHPHASLEGETVPCSHRHVTSLVSCECTFPILSRGNHHFSPLMHHGSPGRVLPVPCSHPHASLEGETVPCSHRHVTSLVSCECTFPILSGEITVSLLSVHHGSPGRVLPVPCSHPHASLEGETVPCSHRHVTSLVSCECTFPILSGEITVSLLSCTTVRQAVCFPCHAVIRTQA